MNIVQKEGTCVILAGAGTGKTYTIVEKLKHLINMNVYNSKKIVCITFSNEAANNLLNKIQKFVFADKMPIIKTFHGFSADLLRIYGERIGVNKDFKILDMDEAKVILCKNLNIAPNYCHTYMKTINSAKDLGISIEKFREHVDNMIKGYEIIDLKHKLEQLHLELQNLDAKNDSKKFVLENIKRLRSFLEIRKFLNAWNAYEKIKIKCNYQDYSDLSQNVLKLLQTSPEISKDFEYLIVDEFQDTNKMQLDFIFLLAPHGNITVVGDLNQSIYGFRGAYHKNYTEFKNFYNIKDSDIFNLDKSYRSPNRVLRTAHKLILNNYENKDECFLVRNCDNREGDKIEIYELKNSREEARKVVEIVRKAVDEGIDLNEICVMVRTHQQGVIIRKALEASGISYRSSTKKSLMKENVIKITLSYLSIIDSLLGKTKSTERVWWDFLHNSGFSSEDLIIIGKFMRKYDKEDISSALLANMSDLPLSERGRISAQLLVQKINSLIPLASKDVPELIKDVYNICGLIPDSDTKESANILLNMNKLYELAQKHNSLYSNDLTGFLHYLSILERLGIELDSSNIENSGLNVMTLHATKGLEYDLVIVTNMAERRFPIERFRNYAYLPLNLYSEFNGDISGLDRNELEEQVREQESKLQLLEERRLCYVAFTRAKKKLVLTYASEYSGKTHFPSMFLREIDFESNQDSLFVKDNEEKFDLNMESSDYIIIKNALERDLVFSPSSLLLFSECQKQYEYKYVYFMPDKEPESWDSVILGSFVHFVLEEGVKRNFKTLKEFFDLAYELYLKPDWNSVNIEDVNHLIRVFFERNNGRYNNKSKTEQILKAELEGLQFMGVVDRIDFADSGVDIIDYKTGKSIISAKQRNWQLGYYALAAKKFGNVKRITLDMLYQPFPIEFIVDEKGNAKSVHSRVEFNIYDIEKELVNTAKELLKCYESGFKPCAIEKNCQFCNEYVHKV